MGGLSAAGISFSIIGDWEEAEAEAEAWIRNSGLLEVGSLETIRGKLNVRSAAEWEKGITAGQEEEDGAVSAGVSMPVMWMNMMIRWGSFYACSI